jgi:hypothetical protein
MSDEHQNETAVARLEHVQREGRSVAEHVLNILKAGLSAAPFAGAIASLLSDYIPSNRSRRIEEFAHSVAQDLDRLQEHVDEEHVLSEQFAYMFEQSFRGAADNPQREKREAFRGVLVNAALNTTDEDTQEYFLNLVNSLSVLHIRILKFMAYPERYLEEAGIPSGRIGGGFGQMFGVAIPGVPVDVIRSAFGELYRYGLITTDQTIFSTMTSAQGLHLLGGRVSDLGMRFIRFCMVPA